MSTTDMSLLLYGLLIVIFLLAEPKGLVAVIRRIGDRVRRSRKAVAGSPA